MTNVESKTNDESSGMMPAYRCAGAVTLFAVCFVVLLAADLSLKEWSFAHVPDSGQLLIPKVLSLRLTLNEGAIFGMMQGQKWVFVIASFFAVGVIAYFFSRCRSDERAIHVALACILAGAMGNLYDRITFSGVRDMLLLFPDVDLPLGWRWPGGARELYPWIFNLADVFLLVGIGLILSRSVLTNHKSPTPSTDAGS